MEEAILRLNVLAAKLETSAVDASEVPDPSADVFAKQRLAYRQFKAGSRSSCAWSTSNSSNSAPTSEGITRATSNEDCRGGMGTLSQGSMMSIDSMKSMDSSAWASAHRRHSLSHSSQGSMLPLDSMQSWDSSARASARRHSLSNMAVGSKQHLESMLLQDSMLRHSHSLSHHTHQPFACWAELEEEPQKRFRRAVDRHRSRQSSKEESVEGSTYTSQESLSFSDEGRGGSAEEGEGSTPHAATVRRRARAQQRKQAMRVLCREEGETESAGALHLLAAALCFGILTLSAGLWVFHGI